ncbi:MAG: hypothetical protein E3J66_00170 [Dehalococcoidia bacterium]|nr:MAG: hypothetical protein E3J66_00170 [Dehalococcoidia bacterium]
MCKHQNCIIFEEFEVFNVIAVRGGVPGSTDMAFAPPEPTGRFFVSCRDCGMEKTFVARRPKWLDRYLDESLNLLKAKIEFEKVCE